MFALEEKYVFSIRLCNQILVASDILQLKYLSSFKQVARDKLVANDKRYWMKKNLNKYKFII
jgi:hypothetical protein